MARFQNACKRTLIFVLLTWGTIFFVPVSALANGVITVTTPLNGAIVTVPFDVHFTYSGTDTYTKLWIDGVPIISDHNGSMFDYTVTSLAAGQHTLSLQAHDSTSNTTVEVKETITVSTSTTPTVTVTPSPPTIAEGDQLQFSSGGVTANWTLTLSTPDVGSISGCSRDNHLHLYRRHLRHGHGEPADGGTQTCSMTQARFTVGHRRTSRSVRSRHFCVPGSTPVLTFHNDQLRSGANTTEFVLNTGNVNKSQFGLKHTYSVDGQIYAQPLYVPNLTINGGQHNVVFVATQNDTVYAFDADGLSTSALWSTSLGTPHKVSGSSTGTPMYPSVGVTSTPVIDPSTNTMYVFATTSYRI